MDSIQAAWESAYALYLIRDWGATKSRGHRFEKAFKRVWKLARTREFQWSPENVHGFNDLFQLRCICFALGRPNCAKHKQLLHDLVKDTEVPTGAVSNTRGRDAQAELVFAAMLTLGRVDVEFAEPDLRANLDGLPTHYAVKRVKARASIERRFKEAIRQLGRHAAQNTGAHHIVVLDVSEMAGEEQDPLRIAKITASELALRGVEAIEANGRLMTAEGNRSRIRVTVTLVFATAVSMSDFESIAQNTVFRAAYVESGLESDRRIRRSLNDALSIRIDRSE